MVMDPYGKKFQQSIRRARGNKVITQEWRTKGPIHVATEPQNAKQIAHVEQQLEGNNMKIARQTGITRLHDPRGTNAQHNTIILVAAKEKQDDRETKVKEKNAQRIAKAIPAGWNVLTNYKDAINGRIWILWDTTNLIVNRIKYDAQMIHCQQLSLSIAVPWMITGDFNAVLYPNDRLSSNLVSYSEIQDFVACLQHTTLTELPWKGDYYRWSNKQHGVDRVSSRFDRVFGRVIFRFFNIWAEHDDFSQIISSILSSHIPKGNLKSVWARLQDLKPALKSLNSKEFRGITQKIEKARIELSDIQGIDGFNAVFFKKAWDIINIQIIDVVKEFFSTGKLYKAINCTIVTLVPKVMEELRFPDRFIIRIMECIKAINYTILVNEETIEPFNAAKGLRQGDPISHFLFAIVLEYLIRSLHGLKKEPNFQYHPKCRKLGITHMSFAEDLLLFAKGNLSSVATLYKCFSQFSEASCLHANLGKSSIYFGGVKQAVKLVKSVIFGMHAYWDQLFILHAKVLKMIEELCRSYIWSGTNTITKKSLVAWEKICTPKSTGGLNLINIPLCNKAAIAKTCWVLAHKQDKLWIRWINAYYIKHQQVQQMPIPQQASWMNTARPKAVFTMWLLLHGRLTTKDRLAS
ncbi:uncharacterized protein LOC142164039 [Nicotiana tabacum]|uniref:Uncharacterized protein LOC142164039 n=1 Tax=Nicotiana tabacum TaxID=4097 RepID=A0AC58RX77_TOBAC